MGMTDSDQIRQKLSSAAPALMKEVEAICEQLLDDTIARIEDCTHRKSTHKVFNDPIWGSIKLSGPEMVLHDSPILQRLGGIHQVGMANRVYTGANHTRLEHSRGTFEAATRMLGLLRDSYERQKGDPNPPEAISNLDIVSVRLGALLHDIGHGPFSHASEKLILKLHAQDFKSVIDTLLAAFPPKQLTESDVSEILSVLFVLSNPFKKVFEAVTKAYGTGGDLAAAVAARILGSECFLQARWLRSIISGPIDADKLDYMQRDCHYSGLRLGLDVNRILSMLEIVRGEDRPELGIGQASQGAYEQQVIARVFLYDRLYFHHKVRAAEAMLVKLFEKVHSSQDGPLRLRHLFLPVSDDIFLATLGGLVKHRSRKGTTIPETGFATRPQQICADLMERKLFKRAFAIAPRYDPRVRQTVPRSILEDTWNILLPKLRTWEGSESYVGAIVTLCRKLGKLIPELSGAKSITKDDILVDIPPNKIVSERDSVLALSADGTASPVELYFEAPKWAHAYEERKHQGFVYTRPKFRDAVSLAAKILLFDEFGLFVGELGDRQSKMRGVIKEQWVRKAHAAGLCSDAFVNLEGDRLKSGLSLDMGISIPDEFTRANSNMKEELVSQLQKSMPGGVDQDLYTSYTDTISELLLFTVFAANRDAFATREELSETELQQLVEVFFQVRSKSIVNIKPAIASGSPDLVVFDNVIIENKVLKRPTDSPHRQMPRAMGQAARYTIPSGGNLSFLVLAYRPKTERGVLSLDQRVVVLPGSRAKKVAQLRFLIPFGHRVPSLAKTE